MVSPLPQPALNAAASHTIGYLVNAMLYGILVLQTYLYYIAFPGDKKIIKCLVYFLFIVETLQSAFMTHDAMMALGFGFGDPEALTNVHMAWFSIPILSSMVSCIVQSFFAWRIYVLSSSLPVSIIIVAAALLQFGAGIVQGIQSLQVNDFTRLPVLPLQIWLLTAACTDVVIAGFMAYNLQKKSTGFAKTDVLLTRLTRMTIETGTLTAIMAILTAVLFLALKTDNYFVPPSYVLGKLYVNNLMMIFNSRLNITGSRNGSPQEASQATFSRSKITPLPTPVGKSFGSVHDGVNMQVTVHRDVSDPQTYALDSVDSSKLQFPRSPLHTQGYHGYSGAV